MAQRIGAVAYVENSALTKEGVRNVSNPLSKCSQTYMSPNLNHNFECIFRYLNWRHVHRCQEGGEEKRIKRKVAVPLFKFVLIMGTPLLQKQLPIH